MSPIDLVMMLAFFTSFKSYTIMIWLYAPPTWPACANQIRCIYVFTLVEQNTATRSTSAMMWWFNNWRSLWNLQLCGLQCKSSSYSPLRNCQLKIAFLARSFEIHQECTLYTTFKKLIIPSGYNWQQSRCRSSTFFKNCFYFLCVLVRRWLILRLNTRN